MRTFLSQRAAVKSRRTQQRFVLWLRRLHGLANPWKRFESLVILKINVSRIFRANLSLAVLLGVSPLRGLGSPSLRETLFGPDPARSIVAQIEKCNQVL